MDIINKVTQLNSIIKSLDDIICFYNDQKNNNPRTQLSVAFLSGRRSPHTYDVILTHAQSVLQHVTTLRNHARSNKQDPELIQNVLQAFNDLINNDINKEAHFMLGDNGVLAQISRIFPNETATHPTVSDTIQTVPLFVMVCQRDKDWIMMQNHLIKTLHTRPIYEHMHLAINGLSDPSMAAFELHVLPHQILKVTTPGGPTRIQVHKALPRDIKYLYDENYRQFRYRSVDGNALIRTEPHPDHVPANTKRSSPAA